MPSKPPIGKHYCSPMSLRTGRAAELNPQDNWILNIIMTILLLLLSFCLTKNKSSRFWIKMQCSHCSIAKFIARRTDTLKSVTCGSKMCQIANKHRASCLLCCKMLHLIEACLTLYRTSLWMYTCYIHVSLDLYVIGIGILCLVRYHASNFVILRFNFNKFQQRIHSRVQLPD